MTRTDRAALILIAFLVGTSPAYAYLDPGSGSMMVQLLLGGVAGGVVLVRLYCARLFSKLSFRRSRRSPEARTPDCS